MKLAAILLAVMSMSSPTTFAWTSSPTTPRNNKVSNKNNVPLSRSDALKTMGAGLVFGVATIATNPTPAFAADGGVTEKGVKYEIIKSGDGPKPEVGELVAIRFNAFVAASGNKIDDIFDTPEPYYTRLGSGGLLQGVETTLPLMRLGDRWKMTIPGDLAFGKKGRPASAGKPRIPADAEIIFEVEMVGLPGKEPELIDLIGDD